MFFVMLAILPCPSYGDATGRFSTKEKCPGSDSRHESQRQVVFVPPPSLVTRMWLAGAALDSLALNVALSTGVAADKAGVSRSA